MGVSYSVYLGPYIEAQNHPKLCPREFLSCPNKNCCNHKQLMNGNFCPKCGTKIGMITVQSVKRAEFDVYNETDERLCDVHYNFLPPEKNNSAIFYSNQEEFGKRFDAYYSNSIIVEFNESAIADELSRFKTVFEKDIARIKEVFGDATVKWGVVAYAS